MAKQPSEQTSVDIILEITKKHRPETVGQLVVLVRDVLPKASKEEILDAITRLESEGKLALSPQPLLRPNLSIYLHTIQVAWFWITLMCTLASTAAALIVPPDAGSFVIVRNVLGILFIVCFPGYTFVKTLFPTATRSKEKPEKNLSIIERVALSIGMSLALIPIVGLLLNYTPWGITLTPVVLSLASLTLVLATTALLRENQAHKKQ